VQTLNMETIWMTLWGFS